MDPLREALGLQTIEQIVGGAIPVHGNHFLQDQGVESFPAHPSGVEYDDPRGRKCIAKDGTCKAAKLTDHEYCVAHQKVFLNTGVAP